MADESGWCTIESDPGVFTELLSAIGVKNVQLEELYSLDRELISQYGKVYGVIFLFKYRKNEGDAARNRPGKLCSPPPESLFFARQMIQNACATQALLSIILNSPDISIGPELTSFKEFSFGMDPVTKGMVVSNSQVIRDAHNSFAPQQQLVLDETSNTEKEDPFHFVAYIPHKDTVYELDGLQSGPREHGKFDSTVDGSWLDVVTPIISQRIEEYNGSEIRFNLMVVVEDPRENLSAEVEKLRASGAEENAGKISSIEADITIQQEKHDRWKLENSRRKWTFTPFIISLLKTIAGAGQASKLVEEVSEKKKASYREQQEKAAKSGE